MRKPGGNFDFWRRSHGSVAFSPPLSPEAALSFRYIPLLQGPLLLLLLLVALSNFPPLIIFALSSISLALLSVVRALGAIKCHVSLTHFSGRPPDGMEYAGLSRTRRSTREGPGRYYDRISYLLLLPAMESPGGAFLSLRENDTTITGTRKGREHFIFKEASSPKGAPPFCLLLLLLIYVSGHSEMSRVATGFVSGCVLHTCVRACIGLKMQSEQTLSAHTLLSSFVVDPVLYDTRLALLSQGGVVCCVLRNLVEIEGTLTDYTSTIDPG